MTVRPSPALRPPLVAALALLVVLAGCGVPTDSEPRAITAESTTTLPAASSSDGPAFSEAGIYLLSTPTTAGPEAEAQLEAVPRNLGAPPNPTNVLEALFEGPTEEEQDRDLLTVIPPDTTLVDTTLRDMLLTVELSDEWTTLSGPDELGAYAQVVLSVTALSDVTRVRFSVDGELIDDVPTEGDPKSEVTRADYIGMITPGG